MYRWLYVEIKYHTNFKKIILSRNHKYFNFKYFNSQFLIFTSLVEIQLKDFSRIPQNFSWRHKHRSIPNKMHKFQNTKHKNIPQKFLKNPSPQTNEDEIKESSKKILLPIPPTKKRKKKIDKKARFLVDNISTISPLKATRPILKTIHPSKFPPSGCNS